MYRLTHGCIGPIGRILCPLLIASALGCGGESEPKPRPGEQAPPPAGAAAADAAVANEGWFYDLRPKAGDVLVPPRIGLRWQYIPSTMPGEIGSMSDSIQSSAADSAVSRIPGITFRVHVVDSLDVPYIRTETKETDVRVTLPPETPPGAYSWWVESFAEGSATIIATSERQTFQIQ